MSNDKRACLARARVLLGNPTPENLRYAALELRLCMEALTYERLRIFRDIVPESALKKWQPPQAVKALLEFEPLADQSFTLLVGVEDQAGAEPTSTQFVGEHKSLDVSWLRKHYHKTGSLLHSPYEAPPDNPSATAAYLQGVVAEIAAALSGNIRAGYIRRVIPYNCDACNALSLVNRDAMFKRRKAECLQCGAEHYATFDDDGTLEFKLNTTDFDCGHCKTPIPVENRKLCEGFEFTCRKCGTRHRVVARLWQYRAI